MAHKGDVETAADIVRALDDTEALRGGNFVMRLTRDAKQAKPASVPLKSICRHVAYPPGGGVNPPVISCHRSWPFHSARQAEPAL